MVSPANPKNKRRIWSLTEKGRVAIGKPSPQKVPLLNIPARPDYKDRRSS